MASPDPPCDNVFQPGGGLRLELLTDAAAAALREAVRLTRETRWESVRSPHVFMGLLAVRDPGILRWGERLAADLALLGDRFREYFQQEQGEADGILVLHREFLSDNVIRLLRAAYERAESNGRAALTPMDLLITMLTAPNSIVAQCCEQLEGLTAAKLTELAMLAERQAGRS
jgi:ATP-dependent Clp protease ATP-binding subunit ClpA